MTQVFAAEKHRDTARSDADKLSVAVTCVRYDPSLFFYDEFLQICVNETKSWSKPLPWMPCLQDMQPDRQRIFLLAVPEALRQKALRRRVRPGRYGFHDYHPPARTISRQLRP